MNAAPRTAERAEAPGPPSASWPRRLDGRFLLPDPEPSAVVTLGPPLGAAPAADLALAAANAPGDDAVHRDRGGRRLVLVQGPAGDPSALVHAVDRDLLYLEHRGGTARGLRRVRDRPSAAVRRLRAAGLRDAEAYWAWPSFADALEYVPLGDPGAVRLALSRRSRRTGARLRALAAGLLLRAGLLEFVLPSVAIVARRDGRPSALGFVADHLERHGVRLGLGRHGIAGRPSGVLLTPRFEASEHVVLLCTSPGEPRPRLVAKVRRERGSGTALVHEAGMLRRLAGLDLRPGTVPELVALEEVDGRALLLQTALDGRPLDPRELRRDRDGAVRDVTDLLRRLVRAPAAGADDGRFEREILGPLAVLDRAFASSAPDRLRLRDVLVRLDALRAAVLPVAVEHGDLAHPNVLRRLHGGIAALDWELGVPDGLPLQDLAFFLGHAAVAAAGGRGSARTADGRSVRAALLDAHGWARPVLQREAAAAAIGPDLVEPLVVAAWTRALARQVARSPGAARAGRHLDVWRAFVDGSSP